MRQDPEEREFEVPTEVPVHDFEDPEPIVYDDEPAEPDEGSGRRRGSPGLSP